jgi:hypothetical protein
MQYSRQVLFSEDISPEDEIDNLFGQLEVIQPPVTLIESIMNSVAQLPSHSQGTLRFNSWHDQDGLVVRHGYLEPS